MMSERRLIVGTVGTDHHRFDRLVDWIDRWVSARSTEGSLPGFEVIVQHGTSRPPSIASGVELLPTDELAALITQAAAVVACGPGTMMECRLAGLRPIAVPRRRELREHVDGHQVAFARLVAGRGLVELVETETALARALDAAVADPTHYRIASPAEPAPGIARVGELVDRLVLGRNGRR